MASLRHESLASASVIVVGAWQWCPFLCHHRLLGSSLWSGRRYYPRQDFAWVSGASAQTIQFCRHGDFLPFGSACLASPAFCAWPPIDSTLLDQEISTAQRSAMTGFS